MDSSPACHHSATPLSKSPTVRQITRTVKPHTYLRNFSSGKGEVSQAPWLQTDAPISSGSRVNSFQRRGTGRPKKPDSDAISEQSSTPEHSPTDKERLLEANRLAASKCRERKKRHTEYLEEHLRQAKEVEFALRAENYALNDRLRRANERLSVYEAPEPSPHLGQVNPEQMSNSQAPAEMLMAYAPFRQEPAEAMNPIVDERSMAPKHPQAEKGLESAKGRFVQEQNETIDPALLFVTEGASFYPLAPNNSANPETSNGRQSQYPEPPI